MSTMQKMTIMRSKLLSTLIVNRRKHRETFIKAQEGYREAVIQELDTMLKEARNGNIIHRTVTMPEPEDHTADYDQAILMLEMCIDKQIDISSNDFQQYIMDDWGWKKAWSDTISNYR